MDESETELPPSSRSNNNKVNSIEKTRSSSLSDQRKYNTELLNIRIIQSGKIVSVHHLPEEVIVKPKARRIEIYDTNRGSLIETFDLVGRNLSWLENTDTDCGEVVLDLYVKV